MSKFLNLKVGDEVLVPVGILYGFNSSLYYLVKKSITRTTATQFMIGDKKFYKEDGCMVGDGFVQVFSLSEIGEKKNRYSNDVISDETLKYMDDSKKLKLARQIKESLSESARLLESNLHVNPSYVLKNLTVDDLESMAKVVEVLKKTVGDAASADGKG